MRRESGIGCDVGMSKAGKCQDNSEFSGVTKWIQIASEKQEASFQTKRTRQFPWKIHRFIPKNNSKNGLKIALYCFFFMRQRPKRRAFTIPSRCHCYLIALWLDSNGKTFGVGPCFLAYFFSTFLVYKKWLSTRGWQIEHESFSVLIKVDGWLVLLPIAFYSIT